MSEFSGQDCRQISYLASRRCHCSSSWVRFLAADWIRCWRSWLPYRPISCLVGLWCSATLKTVIWVRVPTTCTFSVLRCCESHFGFFCCGTLPSGVVVQGWRIRLWKLWSGFEPHDLTPLYMHWDMWVAVLGPNWVFVLWYPAFWGLWHRAAIELQRLWSPWVLSVFEFFLFEVLDFQSCG